MPPPPGDDVGGNRADGGEIRLTVRSTGRPYRARFALHLTVREGLIVRHRMYEDGGPWNRTVRFSQIVGTTDLAELEVAP